MVKSKFSLWVFIILYQVIILTWVISLILVSKGKLFLSIQPIFMGYFLSIFMFFILFVLVFGECRTKIIEVIIGNENNFIKNYFGFGGFKQYRFQDISGYKISMVPSAYSFHEVLYLMMNDKKVVKISSFYHRNYSDLKADIATKANDLGFETFSMFDEIKEYFIFD